MVKVCQMFHGDFMPCIIQLQNNKYIIKSELEYIQIREQRIQINECTAQQRDSLRVDVVVEM